MENQIMFKIKNKIRGASSFFFGFLIFSFIVLGVQCSSGKGGDTGGSVATPPPAPVATPCQNGQGIAGACESCNTGFNLSAGACNPIPGAPCVNGVGSAGACESCNTGFNLSGGACNPIPGAPCVNGVGSAGACVSCDTGFNLSGGACNPIPGAPCADGEGSAGACTSCNTGFVLAVGSCFAQVNVSFDLNGGTGGVAPAPLPLRVGSSVTVPSLPAGVTNGTLVFIGWSTLRTNVGASFVRAGATYTIPFVRAPETTLTLYATWGEAYTVRYNLNGGVGSAPNASVALAGAEVTLRSPTLVGPSNNNRPANASASPTDGFFGWGVDANGTGITYTANQTQSFASNTTLYALWYYPISYDCNGGVASGTLPNLTQERTGANLSALPSTGCNREGYNFVGWSISGNNPRINNMPNSPIALKAIWVYRIMYNLNGGGGTTVEDSMSYSVGATAIVQSIRATTTRPANASTSPTDGFFGWGVDANGTGITYTANQVRVFASNTTLYALWYYPISYDCNGGVASGVLPNLTKERTGANLSALPTTGCNRDGYNFVGWSASGSNPRIDNMPNNSLALRAIWTYRVTYNLNGGGGTTVEDSMSYSVGATVTIQSIRATTTRPANVSTSPTDGFFGWGVDANGTGTTYTAKQTQIFASNTTLYALWYYPISYDCNGGVASGVLPNLTRQRMGANLTSLVATGCTRGDHDFLGWSVSGNNPPITSMPNNPIALKAIWRQHPLVDSDHDGLIEISTPEQLNHIRYNLEGTSYRTVAGATGGTPAGCPNRICRGYELSANIDLGSTRWGSAYVGVDKVAEGWEPIGNCSVAGCTSGANNPFTATFEGRGFTIRNLYINRAGQYQLGLFGTISSSSINQVTLDRVYIFGKDNIGGLVGLEQRGSNLTNSIVTNINIRGGDAIGGLVGWQYAGTISYSTVRGTVSGNDKIGGLVGEQNRGTTISYSTTSGSIAGHNSVGGLVGFQDGTLMRNVAGSSVSGNDNIGGLVGWQYDGSNSSYNISTGSISGRDYVGGLVGLQYNGSNSTYNISTGSVSGRNIVGGLAGYSNVATISYSTTTGSISGNEFVGGLIGQGFSVNISYSGHVTGNIVASINVGGLVGYQDAGTITHSHTSGRVMGLRNMGGMVGFLYSNASISNSNSASIVWSTLTSANEGMDVPSIGGLVGFIGSMDSNHPSIIQSYASGIVLGPSYVGGLVGYQNGGAIDNSYATGNVWATGSYTNTLEIRPSGGLVGFKVAGTINNSHATGNVSGYTFVGGLLGGVFNNVGDISNSYATGNVLAYGYAGGLLGGIQGSNANIINCYSSGSVRAREIFGGFIGQQASGTISNSYATGNVSVSNNTALDNPLYLRGIGGFVGQQAGGDNDVIIENSYAWGTVRGEDDQIGVGGFVGGQAGSASTIIRNSYAVGEIILTYGNDDTSVGGFAGFRQRNDSAQIIPVIMNSYWDTTSTKRSTSDGTGATGLTSTQMKASSGTHPSSLGGCFKLTTNKYPQLYTKVSGTCTSTLLGGSNANL